MTTSLARMVRISGKVAQDEARWLNGNATEKSLQSLRDGFSGKAVTERTNTPGTISTRYHLFGHSYAISWSSQAHVDLHARSFLYLVFLLGMSTLQPRTPRIAPPDFERLHLGSVRETKRKNMYVRLYGYPILPLSFPRPVFFLLRYLLGKKKVYG